MGKLIVMTRTSQSSQVESVEHDRCPKCGAINGPFERLGSGICNECLNRRVHQSKAQQRRRRRERREAI